MTYLGEQIQLWGNTPGAEGYRDLYTDVSLGEIHASESARITRGVAVARTCKGIPRRLADGSRYELAFDKKVAGKVRHRLTVAGEQWGADLWNVEELLGDDEIRAEAAALKWEVWLIEWMRTATKHGAGIGWRCLQMGKPRDGNVLVHRIELELTLITDVYKEVMDI